MGRRYDDDRYEENGKVRWGTGSVAADGMLYLVGIFLGLFLGGFLIPFLAVIPAVAMLKAAAAPEKRCGPYGRR